MQDQSQYSIYPFRFRRMDGYELATNEVGEYLFLESGTIRDILSGDIQICSELYKDLTAKQFIYDNHSRDLLDTLAIKYRTRKSFLFNGIALHIVVLTLRCNHRCNYCQVSSRPESSVEHDASIETIEHISQLVVKSAAKDFTLEIQGGEPLLVFDKVKYLIQETSRLAKKSDKRIRIVLCTNLYSLTEEHLSFCQDHGAIISTSLDGPEWIHNSSRCTSASDSHARIVKNIRMSQEYLGKESVSALTTVSRHSFLNPESIIDEYWNNGFNCIFLRKRSSFGEASDLPDSEKYSIEEFLQFYFASIDYLLKLNGEGIFIYEAYYALFLKRILTPFSDNYVNLESPPGSGISVLAYHYNGDVYPLDEARMMAESGDRKFFLGNVNKDSFSSILLNPLLIQTVREGIAESAPGCSDCCYLPYCGIDPITNYMSQGNCVGFRSTNETCKLNMAIMDHIFKNLLKKDRAIMYIYLSWIR